MSTQEGALRYEPAGEDGIGVLWFDCPGKKVNTLSVDLIDQVGRVLSAAKADTRVRAIVIASAKTSGFIAGADIDDLGDVTSAEENEALGLGPEGDGWALRVGDAHRGGDSWRLSGWWPGAGARLHGAHRLER